MDLTTFFAVSWGKCATYLGRSDSSRGLCESFARNQVFAAVSANGWLKIEALRNGDSTRIKPNGAASAHYANDAFAVGDSIRVNDVHEVWPEAALICRALEHAFLHPVRANLYCSPLGSPALPRHFDRHDTIVVQLRGRKKWRIFTERTPTPLGVPFQLSFEARADLLQAATLDQSLANDIVRSELELQPGDVLYVPAGVHHEALADREDSDHITIGLYPVTQADLMLVALRSKVLRSPAFWDRIDLFPGMNNAAPDGAEVGVLAASVSSDDLAQAQFELLHRFIRSRSRTTASNPAAPRDVLPEDVLEKNESVVWTALLSGNALKVLYGDKTLNCPPRALSVIGAILRSPSFCANDLPDDLSAQSRLSCMRVLFAADLLKFYSPSPYASAR